MLTTKTIFIGWSSHVTLNGERTTGGEVMDNKIVIAYVALACILIGFIGNTLYFNGVITQMQDKIATQDQAINNLSKTVETQIESNENLTRELEVYRAMLEGFLSTNATDGSFR